MKSEFITDQSAIDIQRYLRRIRATLIRMIPRKVYGPLGETDGWLIFYIVT